MRLRTCAPGEPPPPRDTAPPPHRTRRRSPPPSSTAARFRRPATRRYRYGEVRDPTSSCCCTRCPTPAQELSAPHIAPPSWPSGLLDQGSKHGAYQALSVG